MSGTEYNYDEQGQFFPFFVLTITGTIIIPLTYNVLKRSDFKATAPLKSEFEPEEFAIIESQRSKQRKKQRKIKRGIVVIAGWALIAAMSYLILYMPVRTTQMWNPYDILGISESATEKEISSRYKRMALKFHPDKIRPSANETMEMLNERFVEISKAYKSLTDEDIRNNYLQFGHPDGKQSFSIGIALPLWLVSHGDYLLALYGLVLGILLPYIVGSWWYGTQRVSKEGINIDSASNLFQEYKETMSEGDVLAALSLGTEHQETLAANKSESALTSYESRLFPSLSIKDRNRLEDSDGIQRNALTLLWAYLNRADLKDETLNKAKFEVALNAQALNAAFITIALAFGNTAPILSSYAAMQCLLQAIAPKSSPLLQLPYITPEIAKVIEGDSGNFHMTVQQFMRIPESKRKSLATGKGLLTDSQYKTAIKTASQMPYFKVEKPFFKVVGEKNIIVGSLVTLVIKGRFAPPGSVAPPIKESDLEDVDQAEDDLTAVKDKTIMPPLHAPYYASTYSSKWHVFLTDSKQGKVAVPPFTFTAFDQPIFDESGPTFNMQTMKAQFQAPPQAGQYTFVLHVISDSYVGFDTKVEITLNVDEASKVEEVIEEDDISEPEEDSLAGQMQAMRSGSAPPRKKKGSDETSDDESDTDGEQVDDDTSETDTDTDEE